MPNRAFIRKVEIVRDKYSTGKGELDGEKRHNELEYGIAGNKSARHRKCVQTLEIFLSNTSCAALSMQTT